MKYIEKFKGKNIKRKNNKIGGNMEKRFKDLIKNFQIIKNKNWIQSTRKGSSGIGRTFEELLKIDENNFSIPDYNGIEIKTKRQYSDSYTTLFNCNPCNDIEMIKNKFGYPDKILSDYKVLNNSVFSKRLTKINPIYHFTLHVSREDKKVYLYIYNMNLELIDKSINWTFKSIETKLNKVKYLGFVMALRKIVSGNEYFKYYKLNIYKLKSFDNFINMIENSTIRITFKLSIFRNGIRKGKTHNHGVGFDIKESDLLKIYDIIY